jgi:hypothetical protein
MLLSKPLDVKKLKLREGLDYIAENAHFGGR